MTVAKILQWPSRVMPLRPKLLCFFQMTWARVAPFILKKVAIDLAIATAKEMAGTLAVDQSEQHIGFVRLLVRNPRSDKVWCFDVWHSVHFRGRETVMPDLLNAKGIELVALDEPLYLGNKTQFHSYLKIVRVW